jgi:TPR repeat protein
MSVDKVEAVKWYRLAAKQGCANAQCNLGGSYSLGEGVSIDKVEAVKWYKLAAAQGDSHA